ncbi:Uncharacterized protein DAT39_016757, partial [Clarias magur]
METQFGPEEMTGLHNAMGASREKKSARLKATAGRMRGVLDVGALDANQRAPSLIVGSAVKLESAKVMM